MPCWTRFSKDAGAISSDLSSEQFGRFLKASMELAHDISLTRNALRLLLSVDEEGWQQYLAEVARDHG
jgi:hypothetical protein